MALFYCKACGGDIRPNDDGFTGKCEYCGATQTLPKEKDEKIGHLLNRANSFRMNAEFDRAMFEYEKVLELDETEPEAHWGLFLSRYGVEYVKDTTTLAYKPTLHRISSKSVFDDVDYQATIKYAHYTASEQYKKDAQSIESVLKELMLISNNQETYDIFLSYKELDDVTRQRTEDSYLAHDLYNELCGKGYKVFFAPKSLVGVGLYEPKIYSAIISSKVMIVLGTKPEYLEGVWVKNEWSRFSEAIENGEEKMLVPVFKNMEAGNLPSRLAKYQAYDMASFTFLDALVTAISKFVQPQTVSKAAEQSVSGEDSYLEKGFIALEDNDFSQANACFDKVLTINPRNSRAYLGKLMAEMRISKETEIAKSQRPLAKYDNFSKAVRFADQQLMLSLLQYEEKVSDELTHIELERLGNETFKNPAELEALGKSYLAVENKRAQALGNKCIEIAGKWREILVLEENHKAFCDTHSSVKRLWFVFLIAAFVFTIGFWVVVMAYIALTIVEKSMRKSDLKKIQTSQEYAESKAKLDVSKKQVLQALKLLEIRDAKSVDALLDLDIVVNAKPLEIKKDFLRSFEHIVFNKILRKKSNDVATVVDAVALLGQL